MPRADLSTPESKAAAAAANADIEREYGVTHIDSNDPQAAEMHSKWMKSYQAHGGKLKKGGKAHAKSAIAVNKKVNASRPKTAPGEVMQTCQAPSGPPPDTDHPCDVIQLQMMDQLSEQVLVANGRQAGSPVEGCVPSRIRQFLDTYDLVMELLSDDDTTRDSYGSPTEKGMVKLMATGAYYGKCGKGLHPAGSLRALSTDDTAETAMNQDWTLETPKPIVLPAHRLSLVEGAARWLEPFWEFVKNVSDYEVTATSCGFRFDAPFNYQLTALVRVYRKDTFELSLKLPPYGERKVSLSHETDLKTREVTDNRSDTSSSGFGSNEKASSFSYTQTKSGGAKWSGGEKNITGGAGTEVKSSRTVDDDGVPSQEVEQSRVTSHGPLAVKSAPYSYYSSSPEGKPGDAEVEIKPDISLKRNGQELEITKALEVIINFILKTQHTLKKFKDIVKIVPKVGWLLNIDCVVCEGSIGGTWGNRVPEETKSERYIALESFFQFSIELKLFEIAIDFGFGLDCTVPAVIDALGPTAELVLKIALNSSLSLTITYECSSAEKIEHVIALEQAREQKIYLEFRVNILGQGVKSEGGIRGGGFSAGGKLTCSFDKPLKFDVELGFEKTELYGYYVVDFCGFHPSGHIEKEIVPEFPIYKGPVPPEK